VIDDKTFDALRLNLNRRDGNLYYEASQISRKNGKGLLALASVKGKGATEFRNIIRGGQQRVHPKVQEQPVEPTVVDRQSVTFDNPTFDDKDDDELRIIYTDLEAAGEPPIESYRTSGIPLATLREVEGLTENL